MQGEQGDLDRQADDNECCRRNQHTAPIGRDHPVGQVSHVQGACYGIEQADARQKECSADCPKNQVAKTGQ